MNRTQTLVRHRDIQDWVSSRQGQPAIMRIHNSRGEMKSRLSLRFADARGTLPTRMPSQDDGASPCSWTAWLAELDRQELALEVSQGKQADFALVERQSALH